MTIRDMREQFYIAGKIIVYIWDDKKKKYGESDFLNCYNEKKYIDKKITYMCASDDIIVIYLKDD